MIVRPTPPPAVPDSSLNQSMHGSAGAVPGCEAGIPLDRDTGSGPLRIAALVYLFWPATGTYVRHWLEPRSLTSELSCAHHSSSAMLLCDICHAVRDTCSALAPSPGMLCAVLAVPNH